MQAPPQSTPRPLVDRLGGRHRVVRLFRYTVGSVLAAATSAVTFALCYTFGTGTTAASAIAFVAGAAPNWVLNRSWAWQRRGRVRPGREVVLYAVVSVLSFLASAASTGWANREAPHLTSDATLRTALVAATYVATYGVLFGLKFLAYEVVVFADTGSRGHRSRHQVPATTRANRSP